MMPPGYSASTQYSASSQSPVVRPLWAVVGPALGVLVAAGLLTAPIGPVGSEIQRDLGLATTAIAVTAVVPYLVAAAALVAPGYLLGRRWPTATGAPALVFLVVGSMVSAFAPGVAMIAVGRAVAGLGAGTVVGVALALSGQLGGWRSRARLGLGLALAAAVLLGPVGSGLVAYLLGWRWAFLAAVPVATIALAGVVVSGIAMSVMGASRPSRPARPPEARGGLAGG